MKNNKSASTNEKMPTAVCAKDTLQSIQQIDPSFSLDRILERLVANKAILDAAKPSWKSLSNMLGKGGVYLCAAEDRIYAETAQDLSDETLSQQEYKVERSGPGYTISTGDESLAIFKALVVMLDIQADVDYWYYKQKSYQHWV